MMTSCCPLIADQIVDCVATDREPSLMDIAEVAARIWMEGARDRTRRLWDRRHMPAAERRIAFRAARLALTGG